MSGNENQRPVDPDAIWQQAVDGTRSDEDRAGVDALEAACDHMLSSDGATRVAALFYLLNGLEEATIAEEKKCLLQVNRESIGRGQGRTCEIPGAAHWLGR